MSNIFRSSVLMLGKVKYSYKVAIIIILMVLVIVILISQLAFQSVNLIAFSKKELVGVEYLSPLMNVSRSVQQYRNIALNYWLGDKTLQDKLMQAQNETDKAIAEMDKVNQRLGEKLNSADKWNSLKSEWSLIKESHVIDPTKSNFENATMLIANIGQEINRACDSSNITLDPELITYYLGDTYCTKIPDYLEEITITRDIVDKTFKTRSLLFDDRKELIINLDLMDNFNKLAIKSNLNKVTVGLESASVQHVELTSVLNTLVSETTNVVSILDSSVLRENFNINPESISNRFATLIDVTYSLNAKVEDQLKKSIEARIKKSLKTFYINISIAVFTLVIIGYLFLGIYYSIVRNSQIISLNTKKMREGDFRHIIEVGTQDEMAHAAAHLNVMRHSFFVIISGINAVLDKLITRRDLTARVSIECEGSLEKLKININTIAERHETLINHMSQLLKSGHLTDMANIVSELNTELVKVSELTQNAFELINSSQSDLQPYNAEVHEILSEIKSINADEQSLLEGDISSLEDIILQTRILAINVANSAEKLGDQKDNVMSYATEIRLLAEKIFAVSKAVKTVKQTSEKRISIGSRLIRLVDEHVSISSTLIKKLSGVVKNLLAHYTNQKENVAKIEQTQQQLKNVADEIEQAMPTNVHSERKHANKKP